MKNVTQNLPKKSEYAFYVQYLFSESCAMYEIMWKTIAQLDRPQMTI